MIGLCPIDGIPRCGHSFEKLFVAQAAHCIALKGRQRSKITLAQPGASYALVEYTGQGETERLVLAEVPAGQGLGEGNFTTLATFQGDTMRGLRYEQLFKGVPAPGDTIDWAQAYHVEVDNFVSLEDGTGIVHIAPAYGDLEIGRKYGLPTLFSVDLAGMTLPGFN